MLGIPADNLCAMEKKMCSPLWGTEFQSCNLKCGALIDNIHQRYVLFLFTMRIANIRKAYEWLVNITLPSGFQQVCVEFAFSKGQILLHLGW